jgi:hypothetical protein
LEPTKNIHEPSQVDGMKIGESKTKVSENKTSNDKSFQVTTMSVLSTHGA